MKPWQTFQSLCITFSITFLLSHCMLCKIWLIEILNQYFYLFLMVSHVKPFLFCWQKICLYIFTHFHTLMYLQISNAVQDLQKHCVNLQKTMMTRGVAGVSKESHQDLWVIWNVWKIFFLQPNCDWSKDKHHPS